MRQLYPTALIPVHKKRKNSYANLFKGETNEEKRH